MQLSETDLAPKHYILYLINDNMNGLSWGRTDFLQNK